jgi:hypothetical protein
VIRAADLWACRARAAAASIFQRKKWCARVQRKYLPWWEIYGVILRKMLAQKDTGPVTKLEQELAVGDRIYVGPPYKQQLLLCTRMAYLDRFGRWVPPRLQEITGYTPRTEQEGYDRLLADVPWWKVDRRAD